ncbi:chlorohydrolase [Streptococcus pneumoniae]|nr:chlorohydrolase [Streptococcus pneumoniae]
MEIKEQTRKLAAGCSKQCFEVADGTEEVSSRQCFEVADRTDEVSIPIYGNVTLTWFEKYGKATLTRFEEIFEEYKISKGRSKFTPTC